MERGCEMNKIKFSYVWDKLTAPEFTTIRSWNKEKEEYYRNCIGQDFQMWKVKDGYPFRPEYVICHAFLRDVLITNPRDISQAVLRKDVMLDGQIREDWMKRILKHDMVLVLLFSKADPLQRPIGGTSMVMSTLAEAQRREPVQYTIEGMEALK